MAMVAPAIKTLTKTLGMQLNCRPKRMLVLAIEVRPIHTIREEALEDNSHHHKVTTSSSSRPVRPRRRG